MDYNAAEKTMSTSLLSPWAATHSPARERLRGIASMIAAVFAFSIMDATLKRLSSHYGPLQVACMRCLSSLVWLVLVIGYRRSWPLLRATQPLLHLGRGVLGICMLGGFVYAVNKMTLAQTYSLFLAAPLLMTALSVPLHGEQVTGRRWGAIALGLGGVLVILHPGARALCRSWPGLRPRARLSATRCPR